MGDASFDGLFLIEGSQEATDLLLVPHVRSQLLTAVRETPPSEKFGGRTARKDQDILPKSRRSPLLGP